jgi:hypothetical protein
MAVKAGALIKTTAHIDKPLREGLWVMRVDVDNTIAVGCGS